MNNCTLIGRISQDIELRFIPNSGKAVANTSIAVDRPYSKEKIADFFRIVVWGKQGEALAKYSGKGKKIAVSGFFQNRRYQTQGGENRQITELIVQNLEILEWKDDNRNQNQSNDYNSGDFNTIEDDDDIPF